MRPVEKASDYHRDIYVGMVAEELNQAGYFGDACRLYGYLYWSEDTPQLVCSTVEADCANQFLQHWREGALLSPCLSCGQRLDGGEKVVQEQLRVLLEQQLHQRYAANLHQLAAESAARLPQPAAVRLLERYWRSLSAEERPLCQPVFAALLQQLVGRGYLTHEAVNTLPSQLSARQAAPAADCEVRQWAGYAWLDKEGACRYYGNAYLPQALQKWLALQEEGPMVSGLLTGCVSRRSRLQQPLREQWQAALTQVFDERYWSMRYELHALLQ